MAGLNPGAPEFYPNHLLSNTPDGTPASFSSTPPYYFPHASVVPISSSPYDPPSCSYFPCSPLPLTENPFHGFHESLLTTQLLTPPILPSLTAPDVEEQARGGERAPEHQPIAFSLSKDSVAKGPRFYRKRIGERRFPAEQQKIWVPKGIRRTTFMIKNIPYKYTEEMVLELLDDHCRAENEKLDSEGKQNEDFLSAYDFFYLPMDFRTRCSRGYAFVNFTSESCANRLRNALNGHNWGAAGWKKTCQIAYARVQRRELESHFKSSSFYCDEEAFLPVVFHPYRNGSSSFEAIRLGKLAPLPRKKNTNGETTESTHAPTSASN